MQDNLTVTNFLEQTEFNMQQHHFQLIDHSRATPRSLTRLPGMPHTYSMGLRSGEHAGQLILLIPTSSRYCVALIAVCGRTLSYIKIKPLQINLRKGGTWSTNIFSVYPWPDKDLSMIIKSVLSSRFTPAHTITEPAPYLRRGMNVNSVYLSLRFFSTLFYG